MVIKWDKITIIYYFWYFALCNIWRFLLLYISYWFNIDRNSVKKEAKLSIFKY